METEKIKITTEYIRLGELLKFSGVCENGGDAKDLILEEVIKVNGEICTMRGKKLRNGDEIVIDDSLTLIIEGPM